MNASVRLELDIVTTSYLDVARDDDADNQDAPQKIEAATAINMVTAAPAPEL